MRMDSMTDTPWNWLDRIHAEQRTVGEYVPPPAAEGDLEALATFAREYLGTELPGGYLDLLRRSDGLDFNGTAIYATRERRRDGLVLFGFPEQNHVFRSGGPRSHVLFGETGDELFAWDAGEGGFAILDRGSLSVQESFPEFEAMLGRVLRRAFES
jgi:hypothetical protein